MSFQTSRLIVDLDCVVNNYQILKKVASKSTCAATLKANAYGLGAHEIGQALYDAGCRTFFVAYFHEAIAFQENVPQGPKQIFVLNGPYTKDCWKAYKHYGFIPILNTLDDVESYKSSQENMPVALHVDTGMNRLGIPFDEYNQNLHKLQLPWHLILSHLACADDPLNALNFKQLKRVRDIQKNHPHVSVSLCNSSGIFLENAYHFDLVRPGCGLYGFEPNPSIQNPLTSCVQLEAQILQIKTVSKGESVGYAASYTCDQETKVATLSLGYADGVPRELNGKGAFVMINGQQAPVLGRVSMDLITVDVTHVPCQVGQWVSILNEIITPNLWARLFGGSAYQVLTNLARRAEKIYKKSETVLSNNLVLKN